MAERLGDMRFAATNPGEGNEAENRGDKQPNGWWQGNLRNVDTDGDIVEVRALPTIA